MSKDKEIERLKQTVNELKQKEVGLLENLEGSESELSSLQAQLKEQEYALQRLEDQK